MSSTASIAVSTDAHTRYVLRLGDACLIHAQRLCEWSGHAPMLEEDLALSNLALDLIGQARALLSHAGQLHAQASGTPALDEDALAFLRDERDYLNPTLVELPRGDFAFTCLRNLILATWLQGHWGPMATSSDDTLMAIAAKADKEARYHIQHAANWVRRLGAGTPESARRLQAAVQVLWPYLNELWADDEVDHAAVAKGWGPAASSLQAHVETALQNVLSEVGITPPARTAFCSSGRRGVHSEHMGYLLTTMQSLQRSFPGGAW